MAYIFNRIQAALAPEESEAPSQTNIFGDPNANKVGIGGEAGQPQGGAPKTSTEGSLGSQPAGGGGTAASSEAMPTQGPVAADKRLAKNKTSAPRAVTSLQQRLSEAKDKVQAEADAYMAGARSQDFTIAEPDIEKAASGDKEAGSKITSRLSETSKPVEGFIPKTETRFDDIDRIQTDKGLEDILRLEGGAQYNAGEAAFDRMLLGRNAEFNTIRSQLKQQQDALTKQVDDWTGAEGLAKEAQGIVDENLKNAQGQIRGSLTGKADTLRQQQEADAVAENEARKALRAAGGGKMTAREQKRVLAELKAAYADAGPNGVGKYLKDSGIDPSAYYAVAGDVTWEQGVDAAEAQRFNTIMGLLGIQDAWQVGSGFGEREGFNSQGYSSAVEKAAQAANAKADKKARAAIDAIIAAAKGRLNDPGNLQKGGILNSIVNEMLRAGYSQADVTNAVSQLNQADYYNDIGWESMLTADDLKALKGNFRELDQANPYSVGGGWGSAVRGDDYRNALLAILGATPPTQPPPLDQIPTYNDPRDFNERSNYDERTSPDGGGAGNGLETAAQNLDERTAGGLGTKAKKKADETKKKAAKTLGL